MPREQIYDREFLSYLQDAKYAFRTNPLILGGTTGSGGGSGTPPGGIVGQITQWNVAGDTTESFLYSSGSVSSLLDNLNNLRAWANPPKNFWADVTDPVSNRLFISSGSWYYQDGLAPLVFNGGYSPVISAPSSGSRYDLLTINSSGIMSWISSAEGNPPTSLPAFPQVTSQQIPLWMVVSRSSGSIINRYDDGVSHYLFRDYRPFLGGPTYIPSTGSAFGVYRWQTDGYLASADDFNGVYYIPDNFALTNVVVWVKVPPSSGSVIVDVKYSGDYGASWTSIFTSLPSLSSGSYTIATPDLITLSTGTLLKANIVSPGVGASTISVNLLGTVTSASGGGTVTSVSASGLNGVITNVTNPTSTPAITVDLGDITPLSVTSTGSLNGSNVSGFNTGDQYVVLTGDIVGSGFTNITTALTTTGVTPGLYVNADILVDEDGRILSATSGSGAIPYGFPAEDVSDTAQIGLSGFASPGDHVHRGVSSVSIEGGSYSYGNIQLKSGGGVSLTQSSGSVTISATSTGTPIDYTTTPTGVLGTPQIGTSGSASPSDHGHAGVAGIYVSPNPSSLGEIELIAGTNITITQYGSGFTFDASSAGGVTTVSTPGGAFANGDIVLQAGSNVTITQTSGSFSISASSGSGTVTYASIAESNAGVLTDKVVNPAGLPLRVEDVALIHNQPYGGDPRGTSAVDLQSARSNDGQVAVGAYSVIVGGLNNTCIGDAGSVLGGDENNCSAIYGATVGGRQSGSYNYGSATHASGMFSSVGDAQGTIQAVLRREIDFSTSTGWQDLYLDGISELLVIPQDTVWTMHILVSAATTGLSDRASYEVTASISNVAGTITVEAFTVTPIYESNPAWDVMVDSATLQVRIMVTDGSDTETIRWVATVRTCELTYP